MILKSINPIMILSFDAYKIGMFFYTVTGTFFQPMSECKFILPVCDK